MRELRDFLNWFAGISENIDEGKAPSAKQWKAIKAKLEALKVSVDADPTSVLAAAPAAPAPATGDPNPAGTGTTAFWKRQVVKALEELGYDPESAAEVVNHKNFAVDLNMEPGEAARRAASGPMH